MVEVNLDAESAVRAALLAHGLTVNDEEFRMLVRAYPGMRADMDALYAAVRGDTDNGVSFDADWSLLDE